MLLCQAWFLFCFTQHTHTKEKKKKAIKTVYLRLNAMFLL